MAGLVIVERLNELRQLDPNLHWFCPRSHEDDLSVYFDEDVLPTLSTAESDAAKDERLSKVRGAEERRDKVLEACKILAFDGADAMAFQEQFKEGLKTQLTRCNVCVREYHRSRGLLAQRLEALFDAEEVSIFMEKFDTMNASRLTAGLDILKQTLEELPSHKRNVNEAGHIGMYALFEALNCVPFLNDEGALQTHFDLPFRLVQTNKKVKLPTYAPGMACFIFSRSHERYTWAAKNFSQIKRPLAATEFEHGVKPFLDAALGRVNVLSLEKDFLPAFWRGTKLIISKLTKSLVTNHLRTMDNNLYTIALEHFQIPSSHFSDLLSSYQSLLELSASDFWEAMGSISAQSVIETIFRSPMLQQILKTTQEMEPLHLEEKMEWTVRIIKSIRPANLVPPVRAILDQMLHQLQKGEYSRYARSVCWQKGLECLSITLQLMRERVQSGPIITNMIQIVAIDHLSLIMTELDGIESKGELQIDTSEQLCLDIVEHALALDIVGLAQDRHTIIKTKTLDHELGVSGLEIWKRSMRHVKNGRPELPASILHGIRDLLLLEPFPPRHIEAARKQAEAWNHALKRVNTYVCDDMLDRLDSFDPEQLLDLCLDLKGARGLISLLFNGEYRINQAALNVLKTLSGEDDRRGSLMHIIKAVYISIMPAINDAIEKISKQRIFGPCSISIKLATDIFSCLCDSQDGMLRSRELATEEAKELERFWQKTWQLLGMIFEQTEPWSNLGYDKQMMQEFCRETMDFAEYAFTQYSIFASALERASHEGPKGIREILLGYPRSIFINITKWLRLRDEYLVSKAVSLAVKILGRLKEVDIQIDNSAAEYVADVATSTEKHAKVRTKLAMQQKAELRRALEKHLGKSLADGPGEEIVKQQRQLNLQQWASSGRSSGASTPSSDVGRASRPGTIDVDAWSNAAKQKKEAHGTDDNDLQKLLGSMTAAETYKRNMLHIPKKPPVAPATTKAAQKHQDDSRSFLAKRQKEKEEAEKRKAAAIAKAKVGVAGLGDIGKDHTLKGQNVMVSSDEESEDDDDGLDADLFGGLTKRKIERPDVDPRGALGLKPEQKTGPTKIHRTQRTSKDMRARLAPDLSKLHKIILQWDFFHNGDYPPASQEHEFREVANSFSDPATYQQTFQPLLTLEAWQGMVKAREEAASKPYEVKFQNRTHIDSFIELSSLISHAENREIQLQEGDIILFSKAKNPAEDASAAHCLARVYRVKRPKAHCEIVYQVTAGSSLAPSLLPQATVWGVKVQSITPLEREYGALQALQYYDLCTQIIKARPSPRLHFSEKQVATYMDVWNINRAQGEAVNAALENEGFSLIQGPPGSGKTKTIVAIVGGLLTQALSSTSGATKISQPNAHGNTRVEASAPPKKLLVCAPSNAAVDELVMRLKEGVKTRGGRHYHLNIVRIGRSDAINAQVMDVTMDELVAKRLGNNDHDHKLREQNAELFKEHQKVSAHLSELYNKRNGGEIKGKELLELEEQISAVRKRKNELGARIDNAKDAERNASRQADVNRKRAQQAVLDEAHVICATLSGSGHDMFQNLNIDLETVIIDEAAQCVEMSSLIPLKYGCIKCVLVGDPKQLPPTVFSKEAAKFQYEQSLFVRMQNNFKEEVYLLDTQYRMHPQISIFPSRTFYDGLLKDGEGMSGLRKQPWHASALLAPYRFYGVAGQHQAAPKGHSLINLAEIEVAMALYERLVSDFGNYDFAGRIGIITPYKSQLKALKDRFSRRFGNEIFDAVEFNTTDAFQGRESEVIIFSCVRASTAGGIGFLQDIRRMNVGLTRAKSSLWVLGNSDSLSRGQYWRKLVEDAQARDCYITGNILGMLQKPSAAFPANNSGDQSMYDISSHVTQMNGSHRSQNGSAMSSRRPSNGSSTPGYRDQQQPNPMLDVEPERMEGISYRFQDRVANKRAQDSTTGGNRSVQRPINDNHTDPTDSEDVEMADDPGSGYATPNDAVGAVGPRSGNISSTAPVLKKRPASNVFMPRKQTKPRP